VVHQSQEEVEPLEVGNQAVACQAYQVVLPWEEEV